MKLTVFYVVTILWAIFLATQAKQISRRSVYELIDKPSWVLGAVLLLLLPRWWKWPAESWVGVFVVSIFGLILAAALVMAVLGLIFTGRGRRNQL